MVEKAVILAAGSATRMQNNIEDYISDNQQLEAIKKGEKMAAHFERFPFLDYQILNLIHAGLKKINIVLKPDDRFFTSHYKKHGRSVFPEVEITYSFQEIPDGTAHAVFAANSFVNGERFLLLNGDNYYSIETIAMLMNTPVDYSGMVAFDIDGFNEWTRKRIEAFAVIRSNRGKLSQIVEKPSDPESFKTEDTLYSSDNRKLKVSGRVLMNMNLWCFTPDILEACKMVPRHASRKPGRAGEYELPDAVQLILQKGREVVVYYACEDVLDLTRAEDVEVVGKKIRENLVHRIAELEERYAKSDTPPL